MQIKENTKSGIFITFSGNCEKALRFYQTCFGGDLHFDFFEQNISDYKNVPVVNGSLISDNISLYGSDLVQNEGRNVGNHMSIYFFCKSNEERIRLIKKLNSKLNYSAQGEYDKQNLIEVTDSFGVRWILSI